MLNYFINIFLRTADVMINELIYIFWMFVLTNQDDRSRGARDKEELDRAMSLSLADDRRRPHGISCLTFMSTY